MRLLSSEYQKSYENAKICYNCENKIEDKHARDKKNIVQLGTIVTIQVNIEQLHKANI